MIAILLWACDEPETTSYKQETVDIPTPTQQRHKYETCEQSLPPVLALHGFLAAGDTYLSMEKFFVRHGWCEGSFRVLDWNSLSQERFDVVQTIGEEIDAMTEEYQSEKIVLIGHSAGGGLSLEYLDDSLNHEAIAGYIHLASFPLATPPSIPMLNIYSSADKVVAEASDISADEEGEALTHVKNVNTEVLDHFEVATHLDVFAHIKEFFEQELDVEMNEIEDSTDSIFDIRGKAVYFGENEIISQADITVYELQDAVRTTDEPLYQTQTNNFGLFGPIPVESDTTYEICLDKSNEPIVCHLFPYFENTSSVIRLRGVPEEGLAAQMLSSIPLEDTNSVRMVTFSSQQTLIHDRDSLILEGEELITQERATAEDSMIAIFHYDANSDTTSDGDVALFQAFPFLAGLDQYFATSEEEPLSLIFQDLEILVPRRENEVMLIQLP